MAPVVGVLVDDAIVEVENIERHLRMGKTPYQAAMEAADEIGLAVIATTFTLVAVFLPTAFMGGVPGKFFKSFGITAAVAVFFLAAGGTTADTDDVGLPAQAFCPQNRSRRWLDHAHLPAGHAMVFTPPLRDPGSRHYPVCGFPDDHSAVAQRVCTPADSALTSVALEMQPGSTLDETLATTEQARRLLAPLADVKQVFTLVGVSGSVSSGPIQDTSAADVRKATLTLTLTTRDERDRVQTEVENAIRNALKPLPGVRFTVGAGGAGDKMQVALASDDGAAPRTTAQRVERDLRTLPGIGNVVSGASLQRPEIHITPDFAQKLPSWASVPKHWATW